MPQIPPVVYKLVGPESMLNIFGLLSDQNVRSGPVNAKLRGVTPEINLSRVPYESTFIGVQDAMFAYL